MNETLPPQVMDACLEVLYEGLIQIRMAARSGDTERAEAIADALHNVPNLLVDGDRRGWTVGGFRRLFLEELVRKCPDLARLDYALRSVE